VSPPTLGRPSYSKPLPPREIFAEYPTGIRMVLLLHYDDNRPEADYMNDVVPYHSESSRIEQTIVDRNLQGAQLEKEGRLDDAIRLYEANIADCVDTPHPYHRLRVIYSKRKQFEEAIRVCEAYVSASKQLRDAILVEYGDKNLATQLGNPLRFPEWIEKLQAKRGNPRS